MSVQAVVNVGVFLKHATCKGRASLAWAASASRNCKSSELTIPFTVLNRKQTKINQILTCITAENLGNIFCGGLVCCEESESYNFLAEHAGQVDPAAYNSVNSLEGHGFRVIGKVCFAGIVWPTAP